MKKLIIASNNAHKISEIKKILEDIDVDVKSLKEENINIDIIEDGKTFKQNSYKKALGIRNYLAERGDKDFLVLADDSGLEVEFLGGEPGIFSARYAGEHGNDKKNNEKLLQNLKEVPMEKRSAKFVCEIALIDSENNYYSIHGDVEGIIQEKLEREESFGYDPLFYYPPLKKCFSELSIEQKNKISHRGKALIELKSILKDII